MISDKKEAMKTYADIIPELAEIYEYIKSMDFSDIPSGMSKVNDEINVVKLSYNTKSYEERFCEVHEKNIDLHYIVSGMEKIGIQDREESHVMEYVEEHDYAEAKAELNLFQVDEGKFMILFPHEVHCTGIMKEDINTVDKLVFKIPFHG